jgi:phosphoglycolate phosphatase
MQNPLFSSEFLKLLELFDHIIWDWNGTLLNDLDVTHETLDAILSNDKLNVPNKEEYRESFCFPISAYYKKLGYDFEKKSHLEVSKDFSSTYDSKYQGRSNLFLGTFELFTSLAEQGKTFSVLSAAEQNHLNTAVNHFGLSPFMSYVFGLHNSLAESKVSRGIELLSYLEHEHSKEKIIMIGDTDHDYEVAHNMGISALLLADGHQTFERLQGKNCHVLPTRYHK